MKQASPAVLGRALHGLKILVVDDDPDTCEILDAILTAHGAVTTTASDARTASMMTDAAPCDVVISDIAMPGEDGVALVGRLRRRHPDLSVIALSALSDQVAGRLALEGGFDAYLSKPTDANELIATIVRTRRLSRG